MLHFLSFGGPSGGYRAAVQRVGRQAMEMNMFATIQALNDDYLKSDKEFWERHGAWLESQSRGYGYWVWKPYLMLQALEKIEDGDCLLCVDSGCELNVGGKAKLVALHKELLKGSKVILLTSCGHSERKYSRMDLVQAMGIEDELLDEDQYQSGMVMVKKTRETMELMRDWYHWCCLENYRYLDDRPSEVPNHPHFVEHRHDQSVLSLLVKKRRWQDASLDPTYFGTNPEGYRTEGREAPIWSNRNRSGYTWQL